MSAELPLTPYAGTSGWSGSETSEERARTADADGTTTERQRVALMHVRRFGDIGVTWKELGDLTGWHHGQASGTLSVLHKEGKVARLRARRNRCQIYILPQFVRDRETAPHGRGPSELDLLLDDWLLTQDGEVYAKADLWPEKFVAAVREHRDR